MGCTYSFSWSHGGAAGPFKAKTRSAATSYSVKDWSPEPVEQTIEFKEQGSGDVSSSITAVSTSMNLVTNSVSKYISTIIRLQQFTLSLTQATWSLADATRTYNRLAEQNYALDTRRAELQVKLAERSLLITQRTGRQLDVEMARIGVETASRDVTRAKRQEEDKEREALRGVIAASEQLSILNKAVSAMYIQLWAHTGALTIATLAQAAATWELVKAQMASRAITTGMVGVASAAAALGAGYALVTAYQNKPESVQSLSQAQTGSGDIKMVQQGGEVLVHRGEIAGPPSMITNNSNNLQLNINIIGGSGGGHGNVSRDTERYQLQETVLGYQRPWGVK